MNQKQIFTEYWRILDDFEDFTKDGFSRNRQHIPEFKLKLKVSVPADPMDCKACELHHHNEFRAPLIGQGKKKMLIINRPIAKALIDEKKHFTGEEEVFLSKWLEAIGLDLQEDCALMSRIFCAPSNPLEPDHDALHSCFPYIERAIKEFEPQLILQLGNEQAGSLRGKTENLPFFQTYHPADVLIDASLKRPVWEVLKRIKDTLFAN